MNIIVFEPDKKQYIQDIDGSLESMEKVVEGEIEIIQLKDYFLLICNKDGIALRLKQNNHKDNMVGVFFLAKSFDGNVVELSIKEAKRIVSKKFFLKAYI